MQREFENLLSVLPPAVSRVIQNSYAYKSQYGINEIRLRTGRPVFLTYNGKNLQLAHVVSERELSETVMRLCKNSLYSYMDTIREGYISFSETIRVGICGSAVCDGGKIINITDISSLNIRIPHSVYGVGDELYRMLYMGGFRESAVIFSSPGAGKTTLLRDISLSLSNGDPPKRVALIDTRYELCDAKIKKAANIDLFRGYPKAKAIEIATRTMAPEYIVCDEIGKDEAESILSLQSAGVPFIVGAHATSFKRLTDAVTILPLYKANVFDIYVHIEMNESGERRLNFMRREEIAEQLA